jgi:hypothetical protein
MEELKPFLKALGLTTLVVGTALAIVLTVMHFFPPRP